MRTVIASGTAVVMAAVLVVAATEKARHLEAAAATIRRLGAPNGMAMPLAVFLTCAELAVALGILFRPEAQFTQLSIVLLAVTFAIAGLIALRSEEPISCNCFGAGREAYLGYRQILALGPWTAGAVLLRSTSDEAPSLATGAMLFAATALMIAVVRAAQVWKARRDAREDRLSAKEMFAWLPSR